MGGSPARVIQNIIKPAAPTPAPMAAAPTTAEVSQVTATSMDGYDSRKTKAKGRSMTILTSPYGVQEETATLGKVSLLGQ
jgi:hypothetical protein